nr:MAG TPA: holin [Caudoviricetes sp.]
MKTNVCILAGGAITLISRLWGGFDKPFICLFALMTIDFISGIIKAAMGKSKKTKGGRLSSSALFKGLCKKMLMLLFVCFGYFIEYCFELTGIRDMIVISLSVGEALSFLETLGECGVKYPEKIRTMIETLNKEVY